MQCYFNSGITISIVETDISIYKLEAIKKIQIENLITLAYLLHFSCNHKHSTLNFLTSINLKEQHQQ